MTPDTISIVRIYLVIASLSAACIDAITLVLRVVCRVPVAVFETHAFHAAAATLVIGSVILVRQLAQCAFSTALRKNEVVHSVADHDAVLLNPGCHWRNLVLLSVRFNRLHLVSSDPAL